MMKKFTKILAAAIVAVGCNVSAGATDLTDYNVWGNGKKVVASSEHSTRNVTIDGKYEKIKAVCGITVNMTAGTGAAKATISGPTNVVDLTELKVEKGVLTVKFSEDISLKGKNVVVDLTGAIPANYSVSAGATVNVNSDMKVTGTMEVNCSAGGTVNFNNEVKANTLDVSISAGGEMNMNGLTKVDSGLLKSSAGAEMCISNINAIELTIKASAGGEIKVAGKAKTVSAKASAGGEINLKKLNVDNYSEVKASVGGEISR